MANNVTVKHLGQRTWDLISDKKYTIKIRARQKECSAEEWDKLLEVVESKEKPQNYFAKITAKDRWEATLKYIRDLLKGAAKNISQVAYKITKYMPQLDTRFKKYVLNKLSHYSEFHQMEILTRCENKREPQYYLIGILKAGFKLEKAL